MRAIEIGVDDESIGIHQMQARQHRESLHQGSEHEAIAPAAQHRPRKPRQHADQQDHERGRVQPLCRQPERVHVEPHALQGRDHHDREQREEQSRQLTEGADLRGRSRVHERLGAEQNGKYEGARRHQLTEAAPRVIGVREPARVFDEGGAAEEVPELHHDKQQKQQIDEAKGGRERHHALDRLQRRRNAVQWSAEE